MSEKQGQVTFKGSPVTLLGTTVGAGDSAPDFTATDTGLQDVRLSDFDGQVVIISVVPSLDTGVCEQQTVRFNKEAAGLNAKILTISMDLPFAAKRFCGAHDIENLATISDYKNREFGQKYGVLIKELGLLTRSIFIVGKDGNVSYTEIVPEITEHPDYDKALAAAKEAGA